MRARARPVRPGRRGRPADLRAGGGRHRAAAAVAAQRGRRREPGARGTARRSRSRARWTTRSSCASGPAGSGSTWTAAHAVLVLCAPRPSCGTASPAWAATRPRTAADWPPTGTASGCCWCRARMRRDWPGGSPGRSRRWTPSGEAVTVGAAGPGPRAGRDRRGLPDAPSAAPTRWSRSAWPAGSASPADLGFVGLLMGGGEREHRRLRGHHGRDGPGLRPPAGHGACPDAGGVLRRRRQPGPGGRTPARAREHGQPAPGAPATLLGEDWQRPERALEIQLALRLHRLRTT